jgi:hypothetical protein
MNGLWAGRVEFGTCSVNRKVVLSALMLFGALACIGVSIALAFRSFTESSSLFMSTVETVRGGDEFQQYLAMIFMAIGVAIIVFVNKYWR